MFTSKYKYLIFICFITSIVCCSPVIFKPTVEDVDFAKKKWKDASIAQLNGGFNLYTTKCGGCHILHTPNEFSEKRWIEVLPEMSEKSKLTHEEYDLILKYVITKSYTQLKKK